MKDPTGDVYPTEDTPPTRLVAAASALKEVPQPLPPPPPCCLFHKGRPGSPAPCADLDPERGWVPRTPPPPCAVCSLQPCPTPDACTQQVIGDFQAVQAERRASEQRAGDRLRTQIAIDYQQARRQLFEQAMRLLSNWPHGDGRRQEALALANAMQVADATRRARGEDV